MIWMAVVRSERTYRLADEESELFAKADLGTLAAVDDRSDLRNRALGSPFDDK